MQSRQFSLYFLVLSLLTMLVFVALGGGIFLEHRPWMMQWQHQLFAPLCHQMPARSFCINGQPMAVCSRCFGIYTGLLAGWILLPIFALFWEKCISYARFFLAASLFFNGGDVIGNLFGIWQNTLISRYFLGGVMGIAAALLFSGSFFKISVRIKLRSYGRITAKSRR